MNFRLSTIFQDRSSTFYGLMFALIFLLGSAARFHSLDRSLWLDEAWVANSVLTPTLAETLYYDNWLQTSPPLFLLILRWTSKIFGVLPETLRIIPALFGIFSIPAMMYFSLRLLKPSFALIATLFFVFSPHLVDQTLSLKQYSSDVFTAVILLMLAHQYLITRLRKHFYIALLVFLLLGFLSYQSIIFIPIILYATIFDWLKSGEGMRRRIRINIRVPELLSITICSVFISLTNYIAFIVPNTNPELQKFFKFGFYHGSNIYEFYKFYSTVLASFIHPFFYAQSFYIHPAGGSLILFGMKKLIFITTFLIIIIIGLAGLIWQKKENEIGKFEIAVLLVIPVFCTFILNTCNMYPLGEPRLTLFLLPIFVLLFAYGLQFIVQLVVTYIFRIMNIQKAFPKSESFVGILIFLILIGILVIEVKRTPSPIIFLKPMEDVRGAMKYLSEHSKKGDILYVHSSMHEQFKLYVNLYPISSDIIIQGDIGWPCCTRENRIDRVLDPTQYMPNEISSMSYPDQNHILRFLFTNRPSHWNYVGRNGPKNFKSWLSDSGCRNITSVTGYKNIRIDEYSCKQEMTL